MLSESEYIEHYKQKLLDYFHDDTDEGRIWKNAVISECEWTLEHVYSMAHDAVKKIYDTMYWLTYPVAEEKIRI